MHSPISLLRITRKYGSDNDHIGTPAFASTDRRAPDNPAKKKAIMGARTQSRPASRALGRWAFVHKWSSLVCTAFLLLICLTGLPLIFSE